MYITLVHMQADACTCVQRIYEFTHKQTHKHNHEFIFLLVTVTINLYRI